MRHKERIRKKNLERKAEIKMRWAAEEKNNKREEDVKKRIKEANAIKIKKAKESQRKLAAVGAPEMPAVPAKKASVPTRRINPLIKSKKTTKAAASPSTPQRPSGAHEVRDTVFDVPPLSPVIQVKIQGVTTGHSGSGEEGGADGEKEVIAVTRSSEAKLGTAKSPTRNKDATKTTAKSPTSKKEKMEELTAVYGGVEKKKKKQKMKKEKTAPKMKSSATTNTA